MSSNKTEIFQEVSSTGEFKQCPNGHYYQGASCPFCKGSASSTSASTIAQPNPGMNKTVPHNVSYPHTPPTEMTPGGGAGGYMQTPSQNSHNATVFGEDVVMQGVTPGMGVNPASRYSRKLVGWLVTYSNDPLGMDYKLFEGRNIIGRDMDCNVCVNDGKVSAKHAVLLFRAGKYSITDSQSSHGTFVNDEDIELDPKYLTDGDIIRVGSTTFKFRSSL